MRDDELGEGVAYFRPLGSDDWIELAPLTSIVADGPVEIRRRIPVTSVLSRPHGSDEFVDISGEFDLEHGISVLSVFPTLEAAEEFDRKWRRKENA